VVSSSAVLQSSVAANLAPSSVSAANTASCAPGTNAASSDAISATTLAPNQAPPSRSNQDRSERFLCLQAFLRHNEQSDQEEYLHSKQLLHLSPMQFTAIRAHESFVFSELYFTQLLY